MTILRLRDVNLNNGDLTWTGYLPEAWLIIYHMLRCAGWDWVWECDGSNGVALSVQQNHVPDGSMDETGVPSMYTAIGASVTKSTSEYVEGPQSLRIAGSGAGGDSVTTDPITIRVPQISGYANIAGAAPTMQISKTTPAADDFNTKLVGLDFVISGCDNVNNDGTFTIDSVDPGNGPLYFQNPSGVADATNAGASWFIKVPVHIAMWVKKPNGDTWNVVVDRGDATPVTVGTITGTGAWELKHFDFNVQGTGNITISFQPATTSSEVMYVDSIMCFRSFYEFTNDFEDHITGTGDATAQIQNDDEFLSGAYSFVAGDVGKYLILYDTSGSNPKTTGAYEILSVLAGVATLNLRSSTLKLANQTGNLRWRLVDVMKWAPNEGTIATNNMVEVFPGFCLQSPDSSGWRFTMRGVFPQAQDNGLFLFAAPTDVALNKDTGFFYNSGISGQTQNHIHTFQDKNFATDASIVSYPNLNQMQWMSGRAGNESYTARLTMQFDDAGKFLFVSIYPDSIEHTAALLGYVGQDANNPGVSAFIVQSCRNDLSSNNNFTGGTTRAFTSWNSSAPSWNIQGYGFGHNGLPVKTNVPTIGIFSSNLKAFNMTNAQANPFNGDEWVKPLVIQNDPDAAYGVPSEREASAEELYYCRLNMAAHTVFGHDSGTGDGVSDGFSISGTTITFTENGGAPFTADMVGHEITIAGATTPANDGTFTITSVTSPNTLKYENAAGATEFFSGTWRINMARFLHIYSGLCLSWPEEYLI